MLSHPSAATGHSATHKTSIFCWADPDLERQPRRFESHLSSTRSRTNSPRAMCAITSNARYLETGMTRAFIGTTVYALLDGWC